MSDVQPERGPSSEATEIAETYTRREVCDADKAKALSCSSDHHQNHCSQRGLACPDVRHWHAACRLPDCRLGFLEGKVASSCCRSVPWRNPLEEPPSRPKSLSVPLKSHESVAMLPHLFSNIAVSRTRSDPCIFGKDFLRITLPLPGEPNECEANASSTEQAESITSKDLLSCVAVPMLIGSETWECSSSASVTMRPTSAGQVCDETTTKTNASSRIPCLWDWAESVTDTVPDESNMETSGTSLQKAMEDSSSLGTEQAWNAGDTTFHENAAADGPSSSKRPQWDDWWTCQPGDLTVANERRGQQHRDKSRDQDSASAIGDEVDEDVLDEGYLVLDEQEDEQLGSGSENEVYHIFDDEGSLENSHLDAPDCANEESPTDQQFGKLKAYNEDDIWSDEHFVSSQVKGFPPPISILANETHPGLPSHVPKTLWRSVKRDGRFVLQEVQARPREFFQATREYGRLRLQLVRPDSDSTGSYTETASMEDKGGSLISGESLGMAEVCQTEDCEIESSLAGTSMFVKSSTQVINTFQTEHKKLGGDEDCVTLSTSLPDEHGCQEEHSGANFGERVNELLGRTSADAVLKECIEQRESDAAVEASCVADPIFVIQETPGERIHDEGFGIIIAREMKELDVCNHTSGMSSTVRGSDEQYRQDYQHPLFSSTYGFDNVLSPSQAFMQVPIQSAVR